MSSLPLTARTKYKELPEEETDQIAKAASIEQALRQLAPLQIAEGLLITGITTDPALCRPGFVYVADESETVDSTRLGVRLDGRAYIGPAIENGAAVVITTPDVQPLTGAQFILRENPLALLGPLASRFYSKDVPPPQCIALVTGTNGKTSTVNFCRMLWTRRGKNACSIGNLGGVLSDGSLVWARDPVLSVPEIRAKCRRLQSEVGLDLVIVPLLDDLLAVQVARNYRRLRDGGITIRKTADLIIGTYCIERGHTLLHDDRDFGPMERHLGLKCL